MRISELLTESEILDEISRPKRSEAHNILMNAGYEMLGYGIFANVYAKPGENGVLKLFDSEDEAYQKFVYMAMSNPNPHFPKFKGKMMKITDEYYAIRMEKLTPLPDTPDTASYAKKISAYVKLIQNKSGRIRSDADELISDIDEIEKEQPGIKYACNMIGNRFKEEIIDIHNDNIMLRGNILVITDPVI